LTIEYAQMGEALVGGTK